MKPLYPLLASAAVAMACLLRRERFELAVIGSVDRGRKAFDSALLVEARRATAGTVGLAFRF